GGWGAAPLARSTPTRSAAKGHAQKNITILKHIPFQHKKPTKAVILRYVHSIILGTERFLGKKVGFYHHRCRHSRIYDCSNAQN
ncbi:MAG: hypothetical protein NZ455_16560, partial [Bacteroidia bacterium]|nr:hypothetical protein [Bacteroidia bacterium]MDW8346484.1 hypothetical protein [Bacteroidia bacterium]